MASSGNIFHKLLAAVGIIAAMVALWQYSQEKKALQAGSDRTIAVIDRIYDNPASTNRRDFLLEYSYDINGEVYQQSETISTLVEGPILQNKVYPHLNGLPLRKGMDIFIRYSLSSPAVAMIILDSLPEASIALVQIQLEQLLEPHHPQPAGLVHFTYGKYGIAGLRLLFWVSRQASRPMGRKELKEWENIQSAFEKWSEESSQ